jgi:UDP-N-acetylmuramate--alanine ligase
MNSYKDIDDVVRCFTDFVNKVPFYGAAVLCLDDPNVQAMIPQVKRKRVTYGLTVQADFSAHEIQYNSNFSSSFTVYKGTQALGKINLPVPGKHNVYNALAATAVAIELGIDFETIAEGFKTFKNASRRFQIKGEISGIMVVDDYGHHPTEIMATLDTAKRSSEERRTVVIFQPHRYTRTQDLMNDFARSFNNADVLFVLDIYPASEQPIEGVNSKVLTEKIKQFGHKDANYIGDIENALEKILERLQEGDLVINLGAGNVTKLSEQILEALKANG